MLEFIEIAKSVNFAKSFFTNIDNPRKEISYESLDSWEKWRRIFGNSI